jgi:OPA family sugar phosphate sensor protein UhpC-like MFS transporter
LASARAKRQLVFVLTWLAYGSYYLCRKPFAVAKSTLGPELHLGLGALAALETVYLVAYAAGQFGSGALGDRLGSRRLVGWGMVLVALTTAGLAGGFGAALFTLLFGLTGLFQSTGWPGTVKAMTAMYEPSSRGTVMGLWATCYQVGGLAATVLASWLIGHHGWRATFVVPALLTGAVGLTVLALLDAGHPAASVSEARGVSARVAGEPLVWILGAAYFCLKLIRYSILFWLPYFLHQRLGYSAARAGYLSTSFELGGVAGALLGGVFYDRAAERRGLVAVVMTGALAVACYLFPHVAAGGVAVNFAAMTLIGFTLFGPDALVSSVAAQDVGGTAGASTAAGVINGVGSVGAILQGTLTAVVVARWGWDALFHVFVGLAVMAAVVLVPYAAHPVSRR